MVRIRLMRIGKRGQPFYRVVVKEQHTKRDGQYLEKLGHFNPLSTPKEFVLDRALYDSWIKKGAQPSETVANLVRKYEKSA